LTSDEVFICNSDIDNEGNVPTEKDALSLIAYQKIKVLEAYYNYGVDGFYGVTRIYRGEFKPLLGTEIFNLKNRDTALRFIEEQSELLKQFYQV
jgi:hypothetical protein